MQAITPSGPTASGPMPPNVGGGERQQTANRAVLLQFAALWEAADKVSTVFVAANTEYLGRRNVPPHITEAGLVCAEKNQVPLQANIHHIRNLEFPKKVKPLGPNFPASRSVKDHAELAQELTRLFDVLKTKYELIVVVGHGLWNDESILYECCNWMFPRGRNLEVIDTQVLGQAGLLLTTVGEPNMPLRHLAEAVSVSTSNTPSHNAVNDAWVTLQCAFQQGNIVDGTLPRAAVPFAIRADNAIQTNDSRPSVSHSFGQTNTSSQQVQASQGIHQPEARQQQSVAAPSNCKRQRTEDGSDEYTSDADSSKRHQPKKSGHSHAPTALMLDLPLNFPESDTLVSSQSLLAQAVTLAQEASQRAEAADVRISQCFEATMASNMRIFERINMEAFKILAETKVKLQQGAQRAHESNNALFIALNLPICDKEPRQDNSTNPVVSSSEADMLAPLPVEVEGLSDDHSLFEDGESEEGGESN